ncbi:amidohydrolase family protein [Rothia uropygioeca]|nr:amidohydrolase family protein [Kocuria sp. 257]
MPQLQTPLCISSAPGQPTGIDCHAHVVRRDAPLSPLRHSSPTADASADELLANMDRNNISNAVLTAPSFYGNDNSLLLEALAQGNGRFLGTAQVAPGTSESELIELASHGVCGLRLNWWQLPNRPDPADAEYQRLFRNASKLGMHIEVLIEPEHLSGVGQVVLDAGADLVIDHFGLINDLSTPSGSVVAEFLATGRTWVKLSAPYRLAISDHALQLARQLQEERGDRILWGSDWPWISHENVGLRYDDLLGQLGFWFPELERQRQILVENPTRLFADFLQNAIKGA